MYRFWSRIRRCRATLLLPLLLAAGCATPLSSPPPRSFVAAVEMGASWPATTVSVNGEKLRFVVDTAAGGSVIDGAVARRLQLPSAGEGQIAGATSSSAAQTVRAARVELGGAVRENLQMVVTDMSQFKGSYAGIIGNDLFRHYSLVLDTPGGRLELSEAKRPPLGPGMICIPNARPQRNASMAGFALVEAQLRPSPSAAPVPVVAVIDSGAARSIFNWPAARAIGLAPGDPRLTERARPSGINAGSTAPSSYSFKLDGFVLAGWSVPVTEVRVSDFPVFDALGLASTPAVILGADILAKRAFGIGKGAAEFCLPRVQ